MMILNQEIEFSGVADDVRMAFAGQQAEKIELRSGRQLYKFTQYSLDHNGRVTPWWSSVEPADAADTGLELLLQRSQHLGVEPAQFSRARNAVTKQWNSMSGLLVATLQVSVFGFVGRVAHQKYDSEPQFANVFFIGGATQLWIPNLTAVHIRKDP